METIKYATEQCILQSELQSIADVDGSVALTDAASAVAAGARSVLIQVAANTAALRFDGEAVDADPATGTHHRFSAPDIWQLQMDPTAIRVAAIGALTVISASYWR